MIRAHLLRISPFCSSFLGKISSVLSALAKPCYLMYYFILVGELLGAGVYFRLCYRLDSMGLIVYNRVWVEGYWFLFVRDFQIPHA